MWPSSSADAEEFQVEVVHGATVSQVSGDADGILNVVVTRADPNPPAPKIKVERPPASPKTVVVIVKSSPPQPRDREMIVFPGFGHPQHPHSADRGHSDHHGKLSHHTPHRPSSSPRIGITGVVWH
jgi:hypothetical protein